MTNVEQRLTRALDRAGGVEPSPDLWSRVVHSIEEDRRHRRNVLATTLIGAAIVASLIAVGWLTLIDGPSGRVVRWQVMEVLETIALVCSIVVIGPAIRRFGRGYAGDLLTSNGGMAARLLALLDLAYSLVFAGYVVITAELSPTPIERFRTTWATQAGAACERLGGLALTMGVLHAVTLVTLPLVALVVNATRTGRPLPRWVWLIIAIGATQVLGLLLIAPLILGA